MYDTYDFSTVSLIWKLNISSLTQLCCFYCYAQYASPFALRQPWHLKRTFRIDVATTTLRHTYFSDLK